MSDTKNHSEELSRRYIEADWVSEYQRVWALFNYWFKREVRSGTDRECIEALKKHEIIKNWIE